MADTFDDFLVAISKDALPLPTDDLSEKMRQPDTVFSNLDNLNELSRGKLAKESIRRDNTGTTAMFAMLDIEGRAVGGTVDPFAAVAGPQEKQVSSRPLLVPAACLASSTIETLRA